MLNLRLPCSGPTHVPWTTSVAPHASPVKKGLYSPFCAVASVMSDSLQPMDYKPTLPPPRLLCPRDSPGNWSRMPCHPILQISKWELTRGYPAKSKDPHRTLPSWPPLQGRGPKGFREALAPGLTGCLDPAPPPSCSVGDQGPEPARLEACYKRRLLGSFDLWAWVFLGFFFFVHPLSGLRQLCFAGIIPVPHPLHSSGRLAVGDPNQAPSPGPLPLEDERSWVS